jgi:hypothetical protein
VSTETNERLPAHPGFDPKMAGKKAECDGGGPLDGTRYATREFFAGVLTGDYVDHGDPPWRWYLMKDLFQKPQGYAWDSVWCEAGNLYLAES